MQTYHKSTLNELLPLIPTFKNTLPTIQAKVADWEELMDNLVNIVYAINTSVATIESKIIELQNEIQAIDASAQINSSFQSEGIQSSADTALVVYPVGTKPMGSNENSNAVLGTPLYRWNLNAGAIDAYNINAKNIFVDDGLYITNQKIATEEWVMDWIDWLANKIKSIGGGSGASAKGSFGGLNNLASNLVNLLNSLTLYGGLSGSTSPSQTTYEPGGALNELHVKFPTVTFHVSSAKDGGQTFDASKHASFSETVLAIRGNKLPNGASGSCGSETWQASTMISDAINKVAKAVNKQAVGSFTDGTCSDAGKVTIPYKSVDGTALGSINFDMAGTAFYKKHAVKKFTIGGSSTSEKASPGYSGSTSQNLSVSDTNSNIVWASDRKSGVIAYKIEALDSTTIISGNVTVQAYSAYAKGWNDALAATSLKNEITTTPKNNGTGDVIATATVTVTVDAAQPKGRNNYIGSRAADCTKQAKVHETFSAGSDGSASSLSIDTSSTKTGYTTSGPVYYSGSENATAYYIHYKAGSAGSGGSLTWGTPTNNI